VAASAVIAAAAAVVAVAAATAEAIANRAGNVSRTSSVFPAVAATAAPMAGTEDHCHAKDFVMTNLVTRQKGT